MGEISIEYIFHLLIFLIFPLVFGYLALRAKMPAIVGYIISGVVISILAVSETSEIVMLFANVGVILLLFTVGLETDVESLKRFSKYVIVGGLLQIFVCALIITVFSLVLGFPLASALILGFGFSFSSTAVASKIIQDRGEENTLVGRLSTGILIFQDMMVIPFLVIITSYSNNLSQTGLILYIIFSLFKSVVIIAIIFIIGEHIIPFIFVKIARRSRELLNIFTISFIFACVAFFLILGLPSSLAAFIAGVLVGQTMEHYHIFSQIRPLRDIFSILFFVFLGASTNLISHINMLPVMLLFVIFVVSVKSLIILLIFIKFRFHSKSSYSIALYLSQIGEFAFIAFHQSYTANIIPESVYIVSVGVTILSLVISPILIERKERLYIFIRSIIKKHFKSLENYINYSIDREPVRMEDLDLKNHIVLCGYGRVGRYIGRALDMAQVPYIAVDFNLYAVEKARQKGVNIIYGDPTNYDILDYVQVDHAACLISTLPDKFSQEVVILNAKMLNPKILVLTRVSREKEQKRLKDLGALIVVQPEFEAALSIIKKILITYNIPRSEIIGKIKRLKIEHGMV